MRDTGLKIKSTARELTLITSRMKSTKETLSKTKNVEKANLPTDSVIFMKESFTRTKNPAKELYITRLELDLRASGKK